MRERRGAWFFITQKTFKRGKVLTRLEQKDGDLTKIEVDEVLSLVSHIRTKVTTHNTVPSGLKLLVEFTLDVTSNLTLNTILSLEREKDIDMKIWAIIIQYQCE